MSGSGTEQRVISKSKASARVLSLSLSEYLGHMSHIRVIEEQWARAWGDLSLSFFHSPVLSHTLTIPPLSESGSLTFKTCYLMFLPILFHHSPLQKVQSFSLSLVWIFISLKENLCFFCSFFLPLRTPQSGLNTEIN